MLGPGGLELGPGGFFDTNMLVWARVGGLEQHVGGLDQSEGFALCWNIGFTLNKDHFFEGLPTLSERDTIGHVIQLCSAIDIVAYQSDFEAILPMRRRDGSNKPAPILITLPTPRSVSYSAEEVGSHK